VRAPLWCPPTGVSLDARAFALAGGGSARAGRVDAGALTSTSGAVKITGAAPYAACTLAGEGLRACPTAPMAALPAPQRMLPSWQHVLPTGSGVSAVQETWCAEDTLTTKRAGYTFVRVRTLHRLCGQRAGI
jgi:hypothetical protein